MLMNTRKLCLGSQPLFQRLWIWVWSGGYQTWYL